jgi:hypothetical protein
MNQKEEQGSADVIDKMRVQQLLALMEEFEGPVEATESTQDPRDPQDPRLDPMSDVVDDMLGEVFRRMRRM